MDLLQTILSSDPASAAGDRLRSIGRGISAIAGLAATMAGAPAPKRETSAPRGDGPKRNRRRPASASVPDLQQRLSAARRLSDISLAERRERRAELAGQSQAAAVAESARVRRQSGRRDERRLALSESRAAAASSGRSPSRRQPSTVTWIDPDSGRRYTVERGVWDKSSHTLFGLVVDATRPAPDERGYPSAAEWRRRCYESYPRRADRDAFIVDNVSGSPRALDYLRRMARR